MTIETTDFAALAFFLGVWVIYNWITEKSRFAQHGLSAQMNRERERWMRVALSRDLRMIDTAVMASLQQGTGFFASTSIFAIGGCFALLGSADVIAEISAEISVSGTLDAPLVEAKLLGLVVIFAYSFFKFGWSYRLFNYGAILLGAMPMRSEAERDPSGADDALERAISMNVIAGRHFNSGLRAIFFALAYLGWFLGPLYLVASTLLVVLIIANRQFRSPAVRMLRGKNAERESSRPRTVS
ncbi:MAG: DUF599 family protein [Pseudomonadota bacterium]|nr:DUF599 family protein [Pseudomonadota bacterium]